MLLLERPGQASDRMVDSFVGDPLVSFGSFQGVVAPRCGRMPPKTKEDSWWIFWRPVLGRYPTLRRALR
jgi:hypothetical protein